MPSICRFCDNFDWEKFSNCDAEMRSRFHWIQFSLQIAVVKFSRLISSQEVQDSSGIANDYRKLFFHELDILSRHRHWVVSFLSLDQNKNRQHDRWRREQTESLKFDTITTVDHLHQTMIEHWNEKWLWPFAGVRNRSRVLNDLENRSSV